MKLYHFESEEEKLCFSRVKFLRFYELREPDLRVDMINFLTLGCELELLFARQKLSFVFPPNNQTPNIYLCNITNQSKWLDMLQRVWNGRFNYFYTDYGFSIEKLVGGISFIPLFISPIDGVKWYKRFWLFSALINDSAWRRKYLCWVRSLLVN